MGAGGNGKNILEPDLTSRLIFFSYFSSFWKVLDNNYWVAFSKIAVISVPETALQCTLPIFFSLNMSFLICICQEIPSNSVYFGPKVSWERTRVLSSRSFRTMCNHTSLKIKQIYYVIKIMFVVFLWWLSDAKYLISIFFLPGYTLRLPFGISCPSILEIKSSNPLTQSGPTFFSKS